jgi:hypothetical protein
VPTASLKSQSTPAAFGVPDACIGDGPPSFSKRPTPLSAVWAGCAEFGDWQRRGRVDRACHPNSDFMTQPTPAVRRLLGLSFSKRPTPTPLSAVSSPSSVPSERFRTLLWRDPLRLSSVGEACP